MSQPPYDAALVIKGPAATADEELTHIDMLTYVNNHGEHSIVWQMRVGRCSLREMRFDAYEWERLKKSIAQIDETLKTIQEKGAIFRAG